MTRPTIVRAGTVALLLVCGASAAAQETTAALPFGGAETLRFDPPAGWVEVVREDAAGSRVAHFVPAGQSRADWRDIVTVQVLKTPTPPSLDSLHARATAQYGAACADSRGGALQRGETNGLPTGFWTLGCGLNDRSGLGETAFFKAVRGLEGVYVVQRAWRTAPFDPDGGPGIDPAAQRAAVEMLAGAVVCVPDSTAHPCP
jgi:hypothetical protein